MFNQLSTLALFERTQRYNVYNFILLQSTSLSQRNECFDGFGISTQKQLLACICISLTCSLHLGAVLASQQPKSSACFPSELPATTVVVFIAQQVQAARATIGLGNPQSGVSDSS